MSETLPSPTPVRSRIEWMRHFLVYGFGVYSISALSFLVVPIYTRRISAAEYGVLELLNRAQEVLGLIILSGLGVAALAFYQFERERPERQRVVFSTALGGIVGNSIFIVLPMVLAAPAVSQALFHTTEYAWAVRVFAFLIPLETILQVGLISLQAQMKSGTYVAFTIGRFVIGLSFNLVLVFYQRLGLVGILTSSLLHTGLPAIALLYVIFRNARWGVSWNLWKELLAYGLPFIPGGVFLFILNSGDRYFLNLWHGRDAVGVYGVSYKLGSIVTILVLSPFLKIWGSVMIDMARASGGAMRITRLTLYLAVAYIYVGLLVSLAAPSVIRVLAGPAYMGATPMVPVVTLAYLFWGLTLIADSSFYVTKQTRFKPVVLMVASIVCVLAYVGLVPEYAGLGAAWATVISFAFLSLLTFWVGKRFYHIPFEGKRFTVTLTLATTLFLGRQYVPALPDWGATLIAAALFPGLLWAMPFWRDDERTFIVESWDKVMSCLQRRA